MTADYKLPVRTEGGVAGNCPLSPGCKGERVEEEALV
jgi:hypothetical protein